MIFINLFVYLLVGFYIYKSYQHSENQAINLNQNLIYSLQINIATIFQRIDVVTSAVVMESKSQLAAGAINKKSIERFLTIQKLQLSDNSDIYLVNADGIIVASTFSLKNHFIDQKINISDRDYFKKLKNNPAIGLYISRPIINRMDKNLILTLSRRINSPDGSFIGIAFITISLEYFSKLFSHINLGQDSILVMRNEDMSIIKHIVGHEAVHSVSDEILKIIKTNPLHATYKSISKFDNIERLVSHYKIANYPIYLFIGQATKVYLSSWWKEFYVTTMLLICFTIISLFYARLFYKKRSNELIAIDELRYERDRTQSYIDTLDSIIVALDIEGKITSINKKGLQILEYKTEEELLGKNWFQTCLPQPNGMENVYPYFLKLISDKVDDPKYFENHVCTSTGELKQIAWNNSIYRDKFQNIIGTLSIGHDITKKIQDENEKLKLQDQLHQAVKMELVGQLAGGIAHDFNNALSVIIGNVELILSKKYSSPAAAMFQSPIKQPFTEELLEIKKAAEHSANLTKQLLTFARKQPITPKIVNINEVIENILKILQRLIGENITLSWQPTNNL
ncbi:MAG: PAS domain S-box protein [Oligoflexia bacterium]|nr:PAS domain S-box protein [Oligoflexia bacterium]